MEFSDQQDKVNITFSDEFGYEYRLGKWSADVDKSWHDFILYKDLGIEYTSKPGVDCYKIIDVKKWVLTRLKYAI